MRLTFTWLWILSWLLPGIALAHEAPSALEFVENRGQWDKRVRFAAPIATGARLFAEQGGFTYALITGLPDHEATAPKQPLNWLPAHALRVELVGASPLTTLAGETAAAGQRHYLRGAKPAQWASGAAAWHQLRYQEVWPGTDLLLKASPDNQLEYDLLLRAGADPALLRLRYHGAAGLALEAKTGSLFVQTSVGQLTEQQPRAWQTDPATGQRQPVACAFKLHGAEVSFRVGKYDHRRPLVIDPVVQFASYTGSRVENWGFASTYDAAGNLYTAGVAFEPGYPTTVGAYQISFSGSTDIAVMKFSPGQTGPGARLWATYLGGDSLELPHSLLVNARNELLLLGTTSSPNYPTTSAALARTFQGGVAITPGDPPFRLPSGADIVLTRLSANGGRLQASTYLGGSNNDGLLDPTAPAPRLYYNFGDAFRGDLTLDPQGNVYVATVSSSVNFPRLPSGGYRGGASDALVTSLDSSLSRVRWTTSVGGSGADAAYSIQRNETNGDLFVAGGTTSPNLSGATGGYKAAPGGAVDGFVTRLTAAGSIVQSTYLGTAGYDQAFFVRRGPQGMVYVLGQTTAAAWPGLTPGCYQNPGGRQFIQQLEPSLRTAGFATVIGSGRAMPDISPTAFEVDCYGRLFLAGWGGGRVLNGGTTLNLPVTPNALQATTDGRDFYVMQLSDQAQVLDYATFYGSSADDHVDGGTSRFDPQGTWYQALCACNQGGRGIPMPAGTHYYSAINNAPQCSNAALKFAIAAGTTAAGIDTMTVCAHSGAIDLGGSPAGGTWTGAGVRGSLSVGYQFVPYDSLPGPHVLTYTSPLTGLCAGTSTRRITVLPQLEATLTAPIDSFCLPAAAVPLTGSPPGGVFSGVGVVPGTAQFNPTIAGVGTYTLTYTLSEGRCPQQGFLQMKVKQKLVRPPEPPRTVCLSDGVVPLAGNPPGGTWTGPGVAGDSTGYTFSPHTAGLGLHTLLYTATSSIYCDIPTDTLRYRVLPMGPKAQVPADTALCTAAPPFVLRGGWPAGGVWDGPGVTGSVVTGFIFTPRPTLVGTVALIYTGPVISRDTCPSSEIRRVTLRANPAQLTVPPLLCSEAPAQPLRATPAGGTWTGPGVSGSLSAGFVFTPSAALVGTVSLLYVGPRVNTGQCPAAGEARVQVLPPPTVLFDSLATVNICAGLPPHGVQLVAHPPGGVFIGPGVSNNQFNPTLAGLGQHTITYTYQAPGLECPVTVSRLVTVQNLPAITLPADTVLCGQQRPFQLQASPKGGVWSGDGVSPAGVFTPSARPGTRVLTYSLGSGCGSRLYRVTVPEQPTFVASWTAGACAGTNTGSLLAPRRVQFTAQADGGAADRISWDFGDGSAPATGARVEHTYLTAGHYQPQATLPGGPSAGLCPSQVALAAVDVQAADIPNIFTPHNGDNMNNAFAPRLGMCAPRLQVFSRWGQLVFDQADYQNDWTAPGLPAGIYYYLLSDAQTGAKVKGWVEIMR